MIGVAIGGLLVNVVGLWVLNDSRKGGFNEQGAWLHVMTDGLGSVQAIVAGVLIWAFGWTWIDPLASVLIAALVVYSGWQLLAQSVAVLMESAPNDLDVDEVSAALKAVPGVTDVHDLHVWSITSGMVSLSAHLVVPDGADTQTVRLSAQNILALRFDIAHSTLQVETGERCQDHGVH
jgi:cobalt-zinc-cadmium efflux system protein